MPYLGIFLLNRLHILKLVLIFPHRIHKEYGKVEKNDNKFLMILHKESKQRGKPSFSVRSYSDPDGSRLPSRHHDYREMRVLAESESDHSISICDTQTEQNEREPRPVILFAIRLSRLDCWVAQRGNQSRLTR